MKVIYTQIIKHALAIYIYTGEKPSASEFSDYRSKKHVDKGVQWAHANLKLITWKSAKSHDACIFSNMKELIKE